MKPPKEYQHLRFKREDAARWWFICPFHDDRRPSFTVNKGGRYAGHFRCWACNVNGSPRKFARRTGQRPSTPFSSMRFEKGLSEAPSIAPEKLARLCVNYRHYPDKRVFQTLADKLGIHPAVFDRFHVGYDGRAFSFIMLGANGEIVGIRLRTLDGRKYAVKGGRNGLFIPTQHMNPLYPLIVTEGESDCMAAFQMGFQVVGIPGIGQCQKLLADWMDGQIGRAHV